MIDYTQEGYLELVQKLKSIPLKKDKDKIISFKKDGEKLFLNLCQMIDSKKENKYNLNFIKFDNTFIKDFHKTHGVPKKRIEHFIEWLAQENYIDSNLFYKKKVVWLMLWFEMNHGLIKKWIYNKKMPKYSRPEGRINMLMQIYDKYIFKEGEIVMSREEFLGFIFKELDNCEIDFRKDIDFNNLDIITDLEVYNLLQSYKKYCHNETTEIETEPAPEAMYSDLNEVPKNMFNEIITSDSTLIN